MCPCGEPEEMKMNITWMVQNLLEPISSLALLKMFDETGVLKK